MDIDQLLPIEEVEDNDAAGQEPTNLEQCTEQDPEQMDIDTREELHAEARIDE